MFESTIITVHKAIVTSNGNERHHLVSHKATPALLNSETLTPANAHYASKPLTLPTHRVAAEGEIAVTLSLPLDNPNISPYHRHAHIQEHTISHTNPKLRRTPTHQNPSHPDPIKGQSTKTDNRELKTANLKTENSHMCFPTKLQQKIHQLTQDGDLIAQFLVDTMQGQTPGVKVCHRMDAAKQLTKHGFPNAKSQNTPSPSTAKVRDEDESSPCPETVEPLDRPTENCELKTENRPVTYLDILNYDIARLIRDETAEGHAIVNFLTDIMNGKEKPYTPKKLRIKPADRIAAARELLRRGFGDFGGRRRLSDDIEGANAYDTLHTDLAKRIREYGEHGAETARFLLDVMLDPSPDEEFTVHHRMSAAQELLRRGWDTNYDSITSEDMVAYWRDQETTRLSVGQKKSLAGLNAYTDEYDSYDDEDYEAIARRLREWEDRETARKEAERRKKLLSASQGESRNGKNRNAAERLEETAPSHAPVPDESESVPGLPQDDNAGGDAENKAEKNIYDYGPNDPDPYADFYYEPLTPEEQALFDYQVRLESGEREESELSEAEIAELLKPSPQAYADYADELTRITKAAAAEGATVLPNPLAGKLHAPAIRSP